MVTNSIAQEIDYEKLGGNLHTTLAVSAFTSIFIWKDNQKAPSGYASAAFTRTVFIEKNIVLSQEYLHIYYPLM
jgi:hypothetical protein